MAVGYTATSFAGDTGVSTTVAARGDFSSDGVVRCVSTTVNFGADGANNAKTTVSGVDWVRSTPRCSAHVVGRPTGPSGQAVDDEDALPLRAIVTNIVDGVSFDVIAFAPDGAQGTFIVNVVGVRA